MPYFGAPTPSVMNRSIASMSLFRDATDCMENILNVVKPEASVYTARHVAPEHAATTLRLKVAKDCIRELITKCTREGPKIRAKIKSGTAIGWSGGFLGVMPCRALLSPHLVTILCSLPVLHPPQPLSEEDITNKFRKMKPEFNNHRWVLDGELYFRIPKVATGADHDSDEDEDDDGDEDRGEDVLPGVSLVRLSAATKKQLLVFASTLVNVRVLAEVAGITADQLRSYVREYCLRRVVLSPLPDGAGAGAANPAVP